MEFRYKIVSSMNKIFPKAQQIEPLEKNEITGLRGETVSFQIAYYWSGERKERGKVIVESGLENAVYIRMVELVPCEYPCHKTVDEGYLSNKPGLYPDLLSEILEWGFPLVAGQWRSLWGDVRIPETQPAGIYPVRIRMEKNDELLGVAEVDCEVLDAKLPELDIPHTEWFHSDCLADYYHVEVFSEEYWEIVENFVKTAAEHNCNMLLTPIFTPPLDTAVGGERRTVQLVDVTVTGEAEYTFGFEKFRRWIRMAEKCGIWYFEISHLFSQWGAKYAPKIMAVKDGIYQQVFGWDTEARTDILIRKVVCVPSAYPAYGEYDGNYITTEPGLYPDLLEDFDGKFQLIPYYWRSLRVELDIEKTASAGNYPVEIVLRDLDGNVLKSEMIELNIVNAVLPEQDIIHTEWFYSDCLADYYQVPVFSEGI